VQNSIIYIFCCSSGNKNDAASCGYSSATLVLICDNIRDLANMTSLQDAKSAYFVNNLAELSLDTKVSFNLLYSYTLPYPITLFQLFYLSLSIDTVNVSIK
jgi:hypothetical protein